MEGKIQAGREVNTGCRCTDRPKQPFQELKQSKSQRKSQKEEGMIRIFQFD